jgi:hypothetical protein
VSRFNLPVTFGREASKSFALCLGYPVLTNEKTVGSLTKFNPRRRWMSAKDQFKNEKVEVLLKKVRENMEKLGLYMQQAGFMSDPEDDDPEGPVFMQAVFLVGEQAFSEKVQDPEQDRIDREFEKLMKSATPDPLDDVREKLRKNMREGKSILDLEDE